MGREGKVNKLLLQVDERGAWPHEKTAGGRSHGVFLSPVLSRLVVPAGRERKGEEAGEAAGRCHA